MPEIICDTSSLQYLHQIRLLHILPALGGGVVVATSVAQELDVGRDLGVDLPDLSALDWVEIRSPKSRPAMPLINDLGPGETETLMLSLEIPGSIAVLDDALARRVADTLGISFTGTLGLLLDAKKAGLVSEVRPLLDQLQMLNFRLAPKTRTTILELAGETP